jgi:hypothetical protein
MLPSVMPQPVKLSDALVLDARLAGDTMQRSIAGQVEFWARLGCSVERLLQGDRVLQLCRTGATQPLSQCLATVNSPAGKIRLENWLAEQPFPHYRPHPTRTGVLERIEQNGTRVLGRFVGRRFQALSNTAASSPRPVTRKSPQRLTQRIARAAQSSSK